MTNEALLWRDLDLEMSKDDKWHASRVESHAVSAGIPDVDYCYYGDGHIELKFGYVQKQMPKIRDTQVRWMMKRSAVGGRVFIMTRLMDGPAEVILIHKGSQALTLSMNRKYEYWFNARINDSYWKLAPIELRTILGGKR